MLGSNATVTRSDKFAQVVESVMEQVILNGEVHAIVENWAGQGKAGRWLYSHMWW